MKKILAVLVGLSAVSLYAQQTPAPAPAGEPTPPAVETVAPAIPGVVAAGTKVVVLKDGFNSTEGAITMPDGSVLFTEPGASKVHKVDTKGTITTFLDNADHANGLGFNSKGELIATRNLTVDVIYPKGHERTLAKEETRPNDLVIDKKDGVYFTLPSHKPNAAIYYIPAGGQPFIAGEAPGPHGVTLSPDEKTLYSADAGGPYLIAFDVQPDGKLTNKRNFGKYTGITGDVSHADGIVVDSEGRIYVGINPGIQVFDKTGKPLGLIPTAQRPQNLGFGGPNKNMLYANGRTAVFRVQLLASGYKGRAK